MSWRLAATLASVLSAALLSFGPPLHSQPLGSVFTYQGRLAASGLPASGNYDLEFRLFDALTNGNPVGSVVALPSVPVSSGLLSVTLDFGASAFSGQRRWLEIRVQPAGGGGYATLSPRQELTAAPNALWSGKAGDSQTLGGIASSGFMLAGTIIPISQGGTGAPDAASARAALQAAKSGANSDITSLSALATPVTLTQGGTGAVSASGALTALSAQARVTGTCAPGQYLRVVNADGTAVCGTDADTNSGGTLTSVATGAGLTGGPILGAGTVSIAAGGVTSNMIANSAVGAAQIDTSQVQKRLAANCAPGLYLRGVNADGSVLCGSPSSLPNYVTIVNDPPNTAAGYYTSLAIGADGLPVISHLNPGFAVKVAKCLNAACAGVSTLTVVAGGSISEGSSIAIGADGFPVIAFKNNGSSLGVAKCVNAACTGASTITHIDANIGQHPSLAMGADGFPVISYNGFSQATLKVAKCANGACTGDSTITTVDDTANQVGASAIALGADGFPVISYVDFTAAALKVAKCVNPACTGVSTITTVDDPANQLGTRTSIAIGADGFPVISYWDHTGSSVKVAKCVNAACTGVSTITTVDTTVYDEFSSYAGQKTSLAIGADGIPIISYFDSTASALKVAKCANAACTGASLITTVDDPPNQVGWHSSIAVGADGLPVISYFDVTAVRLKVVKCVRASCAP